MLILQIRGLLFKTVSDPRLCTLALTDATGAINTQYSYEAYGNTTQSGIVSDNAYQYTGRENDGTGLYYYRARYYDSQTSRFISQDPIGFGGGVNQFGYVNGNPVSLVDPLGFAGADPEPGLGPVCIECLIPGIGPIAKVVNTISKVCKRQPQPQHKPVSTGRTSPTSLKEKLAMDEVKSNPSGTTPPRMPEMNDAKNDLLANDGWVKRTQNVNDVEIHYVENTKTGQIVDFKYK